MTSAIRSVLTAAALLTACGLVSARTPEASCPKLLPADKLQSIAGKGFSPAEARFASSGELLCAWMRRGDGGFATISVQYYSKDKAGMPLPELFENIVSPHEQGKVKREPIAGVGKRAVFVAAAPQQLVAIERDDAVLRIVMNNFSKAQASAAAKAIGSP
jgi:hypothetical protein